MNDIYTQIDLYNKRNQIKNEIKPIFFDDNKKKYIKKLFKINKPRIFLLALFVLIVSLIEVSIPLLLNFFLEKYSYQMDLSKFYITAITALIILIIYVILSYFSIVTQKKIVLNIVNKIRFDWLKFYIYKTLKNFRDKDKSNIYVKISYHLSLLQMGLQNSFFVFFQWSIFLFSILLVSSILDFKLLLISFILIPVNLIVFLIGYIFSSYYLARDQTLYSKLLKYISETFQSFSFIKALKKEKDFLDNVNDIVSIDNYFRIKREVVLRLGNNIIFAILVFASVLVYLFHIYAPFDNSSIFTSLAFILVFVLHLKLIYLSLNFGLFYFPLKLGLFLCIPKTFTNKSYQINNVQKILLHTSKFKIQKNNSYLKKISFEFEKGKNYLIQDPDNKTNDTLSKVILGLGPTRENSNWIIKADNKRFEYKQWHKVLKSDYYIHPFMHNNMTVFDFLALHPDLYKIKKYSIFNFIFENNKLMSGQMNYQNLSFIELCLCQFAYVLLAKPNIVIVDHVIYDLPYETIKEATQILKKELKNSIYILNTQANLIKNNYDVTYQF
jgi:ABC-type multidrug transport system fused ATPase/permease subunit